MTSPTLEPRIESSLLYTKSNGSQEFVHDDYRCFFFTKWFADRINDGRLSIKKAYDCRWEAIEEFDLEYDTNQLELYLLDLVGALKKDKAKQLINDFGKNLYHYLRYVRGYDHTNNSEELINIFGENLDSYLVYAKMYGPEIDKSEAEHQERIMRWK
ncbi:hypothetical protein J4209_04630 [Candidatus Woesearchaeota archaeon]|nr:hypothetical protein [Candidatus Woesearchaeota archaeon]